MTGKRFGSVDEAESSGLVLRILVEGPPEGGTATVLHHVAQRFLASSAAAAPGASGQAIESYEFDAGQFEGRPIRFEVVSYSRDVDRATRARLRSLADAVIVVVDSRPDGMGPAYRHFGEVLDDVRDEPAPDRPTVTVFAHNADAPGALNPDQVAAELLAESWIDVVPTTEGSLGSLRGLGHAAGLAVRRSRHRDQMGLPHRASEGVQPAAPALGPPPGPRPRGARTRPGEPEARPRRTPPLPPPSAATRPAPVGALPPAPPGPPPPPPGPEPPSGKGSVLGRVRTALKGPKPGSGPSFHTHRPRSRPNKTRR